MTAAYAISQDDRADRLCELLNSADKDGWIRVGEMAIDTAKIVIGDPCYVANPNYSRGVDDAIKQCDYAPVPVVLDGRCEVGVISPTGLGDGCYPVFARFDEGGGRVTELRIKFMPTDG